MNPAPLQIIYGNDDGDDAVAEGFQDVFPMWIPIK